MSCVNHIPQVFFSNRLEVLYQQLKNELFIGTHPFTRRMILVSSPAIKSWLMLQMAQDPCLAIAAGVDICFVDPALHRLSLLLSPEQKLSDMLPYEPSELELSLALEQEMLRAAHSFSDFTMQEKEVWGPLLIYLNIRPETLTITKRSEKRITALSGKLARYFLDYGTFGGKIIGKWNDMQAERWQQALWQRLENLFNVWNYPYRKFETLTVQSFPKAGELQVHAFGLSYLAPVHHRFLMKAAQHLPINYYLLSPCQKFWMDLLSDRESARLKTYWQKRGIGEVQQKELDGYLRDNNPLLANFGKLGREMTRQVEESPLTFIEKYALPSSVLRCESYEDLLDDELTLYESPHSLTLLEAVQADIALLRNPDSGPTINFDGYDGTIQVHAAPKPLREVEAIYNAILGILDKHHEDASPVLSSDVIIMAPNIAEYAPFIRSVFGAPDSAVDYQIMDLEMPAQNLFVQAFLHLLHLPLSRWDAVSLLRLFEYRAFQERQRLTWEDVQILRQWIKVAGIRWGKDHRHRNELLARDHCNKQMFEGNDSGTWEHGLGRLLEGLAMFSEGNQTLITENSFMPVERIDSTQGELLGKIIYILRSLLEDLRPMNEGTRLTAKEWSLYLKCLCDTYFSVGIEEDDDIGYQELMRQIEAFEAMPPQLNNTLFPFHSIQHQLKLALNKKTVNHRESHMLAVRFCSLLPMRSIPAKVIVLMGINDGAFPRADKQAKLNCLLHDSEADYYPSQTDFDRYLFLEALLSARSYFLLSYVSQVKSDVKEQSPSLLVTELLAYMDKAYCLSSEAVSQHCLIKHSFLSFDKRYFAAAYPYRSYMSSHYAAALSHYVPEKQAQHQFISNFNTLATSFEKPDNEVILDLNELMAFARNPLKVYFNKSLGIFLEKEEDRRLPCNEELQLSHLNAAMISRDALFSNIPEALLRAEKMGTLPSGPFREIGTDKIKKEVESLTSNLHMHGMHVGDLFTVEFSERFLTLNLETGTSWEMPALILVTPRGRHIKLIGRLKTVSLRGLVVLGEDGMKEAVKAWPALLVLCVFIKRYHLPIATNILFIKGKTPKTKTADFSDPDHFLGCYLDYFFDSKRYPSPLLPEWVASILGGNHDDLQEMLNRKGDDPFQPVYDDYLKWMGRNAVDINAITTIGQWQEKARELFLDLNTAWYPKSQKATKGSENEHI